MMAAKSVVPALPVFAFQLLNGVGDLFQIIPAVDKTVGDISVLSSPLPPLLVRVRGRNHPDRGKDETLTRHLDDVILGST